MHKPLTLLSDIGLGYLRWGQSAQMAAADKVKLLMRP